MSMSLLEETQTVAATPEETAQMNAITKAVKRGMEPLLAEIQQVKKQVIMATNYK